MILTNPTLLGLSSQYLSAEKYQSLNFINVDYVKHRVNQPAENHRKYQCFSKMQENSKMWDQSSSRYLLCMSRLYKGIVDGSFSDGINKVDYSQ